MNWKEHLFKPKWQHKDADIRLACVSSEQDPQLIQALPDIAANDPDSRVRCAAIARLHRLENILQLYAEESDPAARDLLLGRIRQLAGSTDESRAPLALRAQVIEQTTDKQLLEHVARLAPEASLRHAAIARIERQGLLGDCSIEDNDADNRQFAASRIRQHTTLRRVIAALRKRDKSLHQRLQQRLHAELLAKADPGAVQTEALSICSALEKLAIVPAADRKADAVSLHTAWQRIEKLTTVEMTQRYQRVCERLATPLPADKPAQPPPPETDASASKRQPDQTLAAAAVRINEYQQDKCEPPLAKKLATLRRQLEKAWANIQQTHPDDLAARDSGLAVLATMEAAIEQHRQQSARDQEQANAILSQMQQALDDGELQSALQHRSRIQKLLGRQHQSKESERSWRTIRSQLQATQVRLRELRDWHHWSNNKVRKRLIKEMEILPRADLHPDALLDRVKSLQAEWRALEASEQIPGDKHFSAAPWMWRKFSAAGHTAFDTAKPFLEKRSEIQSRHADSLASFCVELEQIASQETTDWTALGKAISKGRKKLRRLNDIPASERQKYARKLRKALDEANGVMQTHYEAVEKDKLRLIRTASQLQHVEDRSEAIAQAKTLQVQWKSAGSLWRSREQALWSEFRSHLDPLFDELKARQDSVRAAGEEKRRQQKSLCDALAAILAADDLPAELGKVQGLQDQWKAFRNPDRRMLQSFQGMLKEYHQAVENNRRQLRKLERERWLLKSGLLHEIVAAEQDGKSTGKLKERILESWPAECSDEDVEQEMERRFKAWQRDDKDALHSEDVETLTERARTLCIQLEFLAGLPSPESERERRMQYQVERLAESMSGGAPRPAAGIEARAAEKAWLGMYELPEPVYRTFGQRIKSALNTIEENT